MTKSSYCGYIAIIGQPNVGKSTLLNAILDTKISIISSKPQTTRHQIIGVKTAGCYQSVYVDTPGIHRQAKRHLNRSMNRAALNALIDVDVIVFMTTGLKWQAADEHVLQRLTKQSAPIILVINKIDQIKPREQLLPYLNELQQLASFQHIIPLSAKTGEQVSQLEQTIEHCLPPAPFYFPPDQITNRHDQFITTEYIREKLMRFLGDELPYATTVTLDAYSEEADLIRIAAVIWVEKPSQKGIVIGKNGQKLKMIGSQARTDLENYFKHKVFLQLWVKVKAGWPDDQQALQRFGYED